MKTNVLLLFMISNMQLVNAEHIILNWRSSYTDSGEQIPEKWYNAEVPGAVQLDYAKAHYYDPYWYANNWKDYLWMEDQFWFYKSEFNKPELQPEERLFFVSKGIDYEFEISLNGKKLHYQEGMFTRVNLDITDYLDDKNEIIVKIYPAPKSHRESQDRSQANQSVKPAVSYGWDWHPRLIPSGIWDDTFLEIRPQSALQKYSVTYELNKDLTQAKTQLHIMGTHLQGNKLAWELRSPDNKAVFNKEYVLQGNEALFEETVSEVKLWWPNGQGDAALYTSSIRLLNESGETLDEKMKRTGFRKIRLTMNEGTWKEPTGFPKTRSAPPMTMEINNRSIFCKGSNWVNPEIFPGTITDDRYKSLIDLAYDAHFNMLRIWGGGIVNKDFFYDYCDEKGILIWQEFPLSCNNYEGTPEYLAVLRQEATSIIERLKDHACLALWCGGNELFNSWSRMTDQSLALRLLNSVCYELDPSTPFIPTAPVMGIGHGHYIFRDMQTGDEIYDIFSKAHNTAYTEFGLPSPAFLSTIKKIIPPEELWPPKPGTSWESHHAFNAWIGNTWLMRELIEDYFGTVPNLETLIENGQFMQAEGLKFIFEEARRQKPYCSMALNWCFNECWPVAAGSAIVAYPDEPKPSYFSVKDAMRPTLASAQISKFKWKEGEIFTAPIWILNDQYSALTEGDLTIRIKAGDEYHKLLQWNFGNLEPNTNLEGPVAKLLLPRFNTNRFDLILESGKYPELNSTYTLLFEARQRKAEKKAPTLNE